MGEGTVWSLEMEVETHQAADGRWWWCHLCPDGFKTARLFISTFVFQPFS